MSKRTLENSPIHQGDAVTNSAHQSDAVASPARNNDAVANPIPDVPGVDQLAVPEQGARPTAEPSSSRPDRGARRIRAQHARSHPAQPNLHRPRRPRLHPLPSEDRPGTSAEATNPADPHCPSKPDRPSGPDRPCGAHASDDAHPPVAAQQLSGPLRPSGPDCPCGPHRRFIYLLAWSPFATGSADRPLVFKHHILEAGTTESAWAQGQEWAQRRGYLPLAGPGNDYLIELPEVTTAPHLTNSAAQLIPESAPQSASNTAAAPVPEAGQDFLQAIETAGASRMSLSKHLDLLDEITEWLVRAHCAHDQIWNQYYARTAKDLATSGTSGPNRNEPPDE